MAIFSNRCPGCGLQIDLQLDTQDDLEFIASAWKQLHSGPQHQLDPEFEALLASERVDA